MNEDRRYEVPYYPPQPIYRSKSCKYEYEVAGTKFVCTSEHTFSPPTINGEKNPHPSPHYMVAAERITDE